MADYRDLLKWAEMQIRQSGSEVARLDAEYLMAAVLGYDSRSQIYLHRDELSQDQKNQFEGYVERRLMHEPVAHILGKTEFWSLPFTVTKDTLIPRADSETLVAHVVEELSAQDAPYILDLGTGSGCLILSVLHELKGASGIAVDQSWGALSVARDNAVALELAARVDFIESDWFTGLAPEKHQFDCIVSNPPYIPTHDCQQLMPDVKDYEPMTALDGGADGLQDYRYIIRHAKDYLKPGGLLAVECGIGQADDIVSLFKQGDFQKVAIRHDLPGVARVVSGRLCE